MDAKVARAEKARRRDEERRLELENERQRDAVKAWVDSPDFPAGAGPLVFDAAGQGATTDADVLRLLDALRSRASRRSDSGADDGRPQAIFSAVAIALKHHGSASPTPDAVEAFKVYHAAAFDYVATNGGSSKPVTFRRKDAYKAFLLARIREVANSGWDAKSKTGIVGLLLWCGSALFPALREKKPIRGRLAIINKRLPKFEISRLDKPIPLPSEGTADGGDAADIAFDLLRAEGVPYRDAYNFIYGAERMKNMRKRAADVRAVTATPPRRRARRAGIG